MKLLIITQKVDINDDVLGFFHRWIEEFAKYCERVTVICLQKGECHLPENVKVLSLGKEQNADLRGIKRGFARIIYLILFYKYIWQERQNYDAVFVHMNPEYIVLGGLFWRLWNKRLGLWYVHRNVNFKLRIAEKLANQIFTASKESFQLLSAKIHYIGHGIYLDQFEGIEPKSRNNDSLIKILHVGRITPIKNIDTLIKAASILKEKWNKKFKVVLIGAPVTAEDEIYLNNIRNLILNLNLQNEVVFEGKISNKNIGQFYKDVDITVNLTPTGGMDKAVLESMALKTPVITSNTTFLDYFGDYSSCLIFKEKNANDLAKKIIEFFMRDDQDEIKKFLFNKVHKTSDLKVLIKNILTYI